MLPEHFTTFTAYKETSHWLTINLRVQTNKKKINKKIKKHTHKKKTTKLSFQHIMLPEHFTTMFIFDNFNHSCRYLYFLKF